MKQLETINQAPTTAAPSGLLQRACACGRHTSGGNCSACEKEKHSLERSTLNSDRELQNGGGVPPIVHEVLRSPGQPLDHATRAFFEPRFAHDFSNVRVHADPRAAESARAVNALAYTVGRNLVFGAGQYAAGTATGRRLLAHELAHVVQQSGHETYSNLVLGDPHSSHEHEAESISRGLSSHPTVHPNTLSSSRSGEVQRILPVIVGGAIGAGIGIGGFEAALAYGEGLETEYPGWLDRLPNCPCLERDVRADTATWGRDQNRALFWYHPGAATSYRSNRASRSTPVSSHGQQCTYDSGGRLLTEGPGAGTPDSWSAVTDTGKHIWYDVASWQFLGWRIYNRYWRPNNGNGCQANSGDDTFMRSFSEFIP